MGCQCFPRSIGHGPFRRYGVKTPSVRPRPMKTRQKNSLAGQVVAVNVLLVVATLFATYVCGLDVAGPLGWLVVIAVCVALLGTALGLGASSLARSEFQAVQLMPAVVLPQFLLCGLLVPRDDLPTALRLVSDVLPLSYAVDALTAVSRGAEPWPGIGGELAVVGGFIVAALALGAATLPRRTP